MQPERAHTGFRRVDGNPLGGRRYSRSGQQESALGEQRHEVVPARLRGGHDDRRLAPPVDLLAEGPGEQREPRAGLGRDQRAGRVVPQVGPLLDVAVGAALRHVAQVERARPHPAYVADARQHPGHPLGLPGPDVGAVAEAGEHQPLAPPAARDGPAAAAPSRVEPSPRAAAYSTPVAALTTAPATTSPVDLGGDRTRRTRGCP